mmetsp:Transcript_40814/g.73706  ORF Transcript_40814/g.73706 Transcript_40814/m.73706 type:complete len:562 (-) Transcript_40814:9-1694(-)
MKPRFSEAEVSRRIESIKDVLDQLQACGGWSKVNLRQKETLTSAIVSELQQVTETLVWGEVHDHGLFAVFCEYQVLGAVVTALCSVSTPKRVKLQMFQTTSILVQNARCSTSLIYLLSGGLLSRLFSDPVGLDDHETLSYFVTLLKSVAMRLDGSNAPLCLTRASSSRKADAASLGDEHYLRVPVLECAVKLTGHQDRLVKTAAKTAVLSVLHVNEPRLRAVTTDVACNLLAPLLGRMLHKLHKAAQVAETNSVKLSDVAAELDDLESFGSDLLALEIPQLRCAMAKHGFELDATGDACMLCATTAAHTAGLSNGLTNIPGMQRALCTSRWQFILEEYARNGKLHFPYDLSAKENAATILHTCCARVLPEEEMRQFVVQLVLLVSRPEDLCIDQTNKQQASKLLDKLWERLEGYCKDVPALRLPPRAFDALDAMSVSLYETCNRAMALRSDLHTSLSDSEAATLGKLKATSPRVFIQDIADSQKRRFHVIEYDSTTQKPTERLACDNLNRSMVSLRWATLFGAAAIVYDQQARSSLVLKEQMNSPDVARLMSAARAAFGQE